jgi:membrane protease YdiL (CAAX protease family)
MSQNSSNKRRLRARIGRVVAAIALPAWAYVSVFVLSSSVVSFFLAGLFEQTGINVRHVDMSLLVVIASTLTYLVGLAIMLIEPYVLRGMNRRQLRELLGFQRRPVIADLPKAILGWAGYYMVIVVILYAIAWLVPQFDSQQAQQIGFEASGTLLDKLYAFLTIVIVAPIVEEIIFRGYLQGSLRRFMPWWLGALITSVLFGYVHGQWNVGVEVFVLSMVACYLRERTGSIWAGIWLHMLKNSIAYYLIFWAPAWLLLLLDGA